MIFYKEDKESKTTIITCNCGCGNEIHLTKNNFEEINEPNYELSTYSCNWYTEQDGILSIIGKRIKRAWSALRGKDYLYQDVCLTKNEFNELLNELNKMKEE